MYNILSIGRANMFVTPCFSWCLDNLIAVLFTNEEFGLNHHSDKKLTWWPMLGLYIKYKLKGIYQGWSYFSQEKLWVNWKNWVLRKVTYWRGLDDSSKLGSYKFFIFNFYHFFSFSTNLDLIFFYSSLMWIVSTIYGLVYGAQQQQKLLIKLLGAFDILIVLGWGGFVSLLVLVFF